jgi:hypothetical protein
MPKIARPRTDFPADKFDLPFLAYEDPARFSAKLYPHDTDGGIVVVVGTIYNFDLGTRFGFEGYFDFSGKVGSTRGNGTSPAWWKKLQPDARELLVRSSNEVIEHLMHHYYDDMRFLERMFNSSIKVVGDTAWPKEIRRVGDWLVTRTDTEKNTFFQATYDSV